MNKEDEIKYDWFVWQKYEFKILTLIVMLADNNLAYCGTMKDALFLYVKHTTQNNRFCRRNNFALPISSTGVKI